MRTLAEIEQMCSAPSDAYSTGEWCELANDLLARLQAIDALLGDPAQAHRMIQRVEISRIVHGITISRPRGLTG